MELSSQGLAHYIQVGKSVLVLLPTTTPGIKGSATMDEMTRVVKGGQFLPGLIYQQGYFPLTIPVRMGVAGIEAKIPDTYDNYTRYLDMRNGGVIRWNKGFADDYGETLIHERDGVPFLRYTSGPTSVDMDLTDNNIMFKIVRENTGIVALDDLDYLNMLLMLGLCVTWMGGKLFEAGNGLLFWILERAGVPAAARELALRMDAVATDVCGWCTRHSNRSEEMTPEEFAAHVGMVKEMAKRRCLAPGRFVRTRLHWCAENVPRLKMFESIIPWKHYPRCRVIGPLSLNDMTMVSELRDKLLAALELPRRSNPVEFNIQDYLRSNVPWT